MTTMVSATQTVAPTQVPRTPDNLVYLIDKCKQLRQLRQIHAAVLRHGLHERYMLNFKLQRSYASLGHLDYSTTLFRKTQNPNVYFFTSIINAHAVNGLCNEALLLYIEMLSEFVEPNAFTFSSVLKCCGEKTGKMVHAHVLKFGLGGDLYVSSGLVDVYARNGDVGSARKVFDGMPERGLVSVTSMITGYAKCGELEEARVLFDEMKERDVICWNVMIDGYVQYGRANEGLMLFREMLKERVRADEVTVVAVLSACAQLGALETGRWVHSYIRNKGIRVNVHVGTALVDMYSKCGSLDDARLVFDRISEKDIVLWNSMIVGYAMHGFGREAMELFSELCEIGFRPTDITFIGVLSACAHGGLVDEGWKIFYLMEGEYGIEPKVEHYGCMVNLLGRAGHLEQAYELVKSMKIKPDPVLWRTLVGVCRLHNNIVLGEEIANFLIQQDLASSGTYTLLSNMYAAAGDWDSVAKMRTLMKENGVEKEPGCSSIEVNNKVHEFLAGDLRHSKSKEIYVMLEEIDGWCRVHGYTPQTNIVLNDIEEAQKEQSLLVHSEKLAVAFGLISTQRRATIRIVKNLRVCSDCHSMFKLISKITDRKIIMRDRNRFHHFVNGLCSCGDHW